MCMYVMYIWMYNKLTKWHMGDCIYWVVNEFDLKVTLCFKKACKFSTISRPQELIISII